MTQREIEGYRGPVQQAIVTKQLTPGARSTQETLDFDRYGRWVRFSCKNPDGSEGQDDFEGGVGGQVEINTNEDGSRTETHRLIEHENLMYAPVREMRDVAFPTRGASRAEVMYDAAGHPTEARFLTSAGETTSLGRFRVNEEGWIVEIVQYSGDNPALPLSTAEREALREVDRERLQSFLDPGGVESRTVCVHDKSGKIVERTSYLGFDILSSHTTCVYNEHGDKVKELRRTANPDQLWAWQFDYDYDEYGNWTRQTITRWVSHWFDQ